MDITGCITWATGVNKTILESSSILVGENATLQEETLSGKKISILKGSFVPTKYSIEMEFDWEKPVRDGKTEYQLFLEWYEYRHKFGTVPFIFPKIIYSPKTGIKIEDENTLCEYEYYKIEGPIDGAKYGNSVKVKMTWKSVYTGIISIADPISVMNGILKVTKDYVEVSFSTDSDIEPILSDFSLIIDYTTADIGGFVFDSFEGRLYFATPLSSGHHRVVVEYKNDSFNWEGNV